MKSSPDSTLVILLGASDFPKLPEHMSNPAFRKSAAAFRLYLREPDGFGIPDKNVLDLFGSLEGPSAQDDEIVHFLKRRMKEMQRSRIPATDLITYYVGHGGFFPPHDQYFLALACTKAGNESISGYPIHSLAATLKEQTPWLRRYLILDCCFSGAAYQAFQSCGPMEVAWKKTEEVLPSRGTALLCASSHQDPAKAPPGHDYTMFSGALLDVLRQGSPDLPERMSLAQVGEHAMELLRQRFADLAVRPEVHSPDQKKGDLAKFPLFPNRGMMSVPPRRERPPRKVIVEPPPRRTPRRRIPRAVWVLGTFLLAAALLITVGYFTGIFNREREGEPDLGSLSREERIRRSIKIKTHTDWSRKVGEFKGQPIYSNCWWIEAPPEIMDDIVQVEYKANGYGPYITRDRQRGFINERDKGFKLCYEGIGPIGWWDDVIIQFRDGSQVTLRFLMSKGLQDP
jgi:hypothetical protein